MVPYLLHRIIMNRLCQIFKQNIRIVIKMSIILREKQFACRYNHNYRSKKGNRMHMRQVIREREREERTWNLSWKITEFIL